MRSAPGTAEPEGAPYRGRWAVRAVFDLAHARHGVRVGAGIAGAVVAIGAMVGLLFLFPEWGRQEVSPVHMLVVALVLIGAIAGALRLASGPWVALSFDGNIVSLQTHNGTTLSRCAVEELGRETATCRMSTIQVPAVILKFPLRRQLVLAVNWPAERIPWRSGSQQLGEPTHLVATPLWPTLLGHLLLADELAQPELVAAAPEAPVEIAPVPLWRRHQAWGVAIIPVGAIVVASLWPGMAEPNPDCWAAERCCLAIVNRKAPAAAQELRKCTVLALSAKDQCGELRTQAESRAAAAEVDCDASPLDRYDAYTWSDQARSVPDAGSQWSPKPRYPRVSCREATQRLQRAVKEQRDGALVVVRPTSIMIQALTLTDPNALVYCDGYPLPVTNPSMASDEAPIVQSAGGPHAVLLRPLAAGRFDLRQYCLGCNSVGAEPSR